MNTEEFERKKAQYRAQYEAYTEKCCPSTQLLEETEQLKMEIEIITKTIKESENKIKQATNELSDATDADLERIRQILNAEMSQIQESRIIMTETINKYDECIEKLNEIEEEQIHSFRKLEGMRVDLLESFDNKLVSEGILLDRCLFCHDKFAIMTKICGLGCTKKGRDSCNLILCLDCVRYFFELNTTHSHSSVKCLLCAKMSQIRTRKTYELYTIETSMMHLVDNLLIHHFPGLPVISCGKEGCPDLFRTLDDLWSHKRGDRENIPTCQETRKRCIRCYNYRHLSKYENNNNYCIYCDVSGNSDESDSNSDSDED